MPQQIVGPLTYIDVRGQDQSTAESNLTAAGILYQYAAGVYSAQYARGEIAIQDPDPDVTTEIDSEDVATLTLSLGARPSPAGMICHSFGFGLSF